MLLRTLILVAVVLFSFPVVSGQSKWGAQPGPVVLAWSAAGDGPLFVADAQPKSKDGLIYDGGGFSLRLADVLVYDRKLDCFSLWLGRESGEQLTVLRRSGGSYRGALSGGGDLGLNDFGKLKLIWLSSGERFLFTEINSEWHCVAVEDVRGRKLFIDYDREGAVTLVRDGERSLEPVYRDGRLVRAYQSWPLRSGGRELATTLLGWEEKGNYKP